jgi:hypothetical protein
MEGPAMPVGPLHHRRHAEATVEWSHHVPQVRTITTISAIIISH